MIEGRDVVAFIPYGREATVSVLLPYLRRDHERGLLDEVWLCLNTDDDQVSDLRYAYLLARQYAWIRTVERPRNVPRLVPKQRNTGYFYRYMTDRNTVFVRIDDDIVYVHPDALDTLVRTTIECAGSTLCVFAFIWNNAICSYYAQKHGKMTTAAGVVGRPFCMDPIGWGDGHFAVAIHDQLLAGLEAQGDDYAKEVYLYQDIPLEVGTQFSVSCFGIMGGRYADLPTPGVLTYPEEEAWHTVHQPRALALPNIIAGSALVSHFTFYPQGDVVRGTDILTRYRRLSEKIG